MKFRTVFSSLVGVVLMITLVSPADARRKPPPKQILLRGDSQSFAAVVLPLREAFEKATGVRLWLIAQTSPMAGIVEMDSGGADGIVAAITLEELRKQLNAKGVLLANRTMVQQFTISEDPITYRVIVNPKNTVVSLKERYLRKILSGKYRNWDDVYGADAPIRVVWGKWSTGTPWVLNNLVMDGEEILKDTLTVDGVDEIVSKVAEDPNTIAVVPSTAVTDKVKVLETVELTIKGPFRMVTISFPSENLFKFIEFASGEGQRYLGY